MFFYLYRIACLGSLDYCSPSCGTTHRGISCDDACKTRGNKYYWCNIGESWDYCSLTSCPVIPPSGYKDCSQKFVDKTVLFENRYYPGYWLAKGYAYKDAAIWEPSDRQDLFSLGSSVGSQISTHRKPLGFKGIKCSFQVLLELLNSGLKGVALREVHFVLVVVFFTELSKEDWLLLSKLWVSYLRQSVSALDNIIL